MQEMDGRLKSVADAVNRITEEDARRDKALADQEKRIATLENDLKLKSQEIEYLQEKLNGLQGEIQTKANKVLVWVLGSVGVAGFALTILQFFI